MSTTEQENVLGGMDTKHDEDAASNVTPGWEEQENVASKKDEDAASNVTPGWKENNADPTSDADAKSNPDSYGTPDWDKASKASEPICVDSEGEQAPVLLGKERPAPHLAVEAKPSRAANELELECEGLGYSVQQGKGEWKDLLTDISLSCKTGDLVAFMGPSGSGKTTALRLLAGMIQAKKGSEISGDVRINDHKREFYEIKSFASFIPQEDNLLATMTVEEAFLFCAELRLASETREERRERALQLLKDLGMEKCAGTKIGTPDERIRGVSGGERRRVSIGIELLSRPKLVFADEPTSGLDAHTAKEVIQFLHGLTEQKKCLVITSIHQPSSTIFQMYNKLLLLDAGRLLFYGNPHEEAVERFNAIGAPLPAMTNPADHYISVISTRGDESTALKDKLHTLHKEVVQKAIEAAQQEAELERAKANAANKDKYTSPARRGSVASMQSLSRRMSLGSLTSEVPLDLLFFATKPASFGAQFLVLIQRHARNQLRNPFLTITRIVLALLSAVVLSVVYAGMENNLKSLQDRQMLMITSATLPMFHSILPTLQAFPTEKPTIGREYGAGMYNLGIYSLTRFFVELPVSLAAPFVYSVLVFYITGCNDVDGSRFLIFWATQALMANIGTGYGYMISTIAPNPDAALAIAPCFTTIDIFLSGAYSCLCDLPKSLRWLQYLSAVRFGVTALKRNEFEGLVVECDGDELISMPDGLGGALLVCPITSGEQFLAMDDIVDLNITWCILALVGLFFFWRLAAHIAIVLNMNSDGTGCSCGGLSKKKGADPQQRKTGAGAGPQIESAPSCKSAKGSKVTLACNHVTYSIKSKKGRKVLVDDLDLSLQPGEMLAIMGTSGSGKTTSLRLLAGRRQHLKGAKVDGSIFANGQPLGTAFHDNSVFIPQNDALLGTMTVRESLMLSARLRLPKTMAKEEKVRRVDEMIDLLGLGKCQHTLVGTDDEQIRGVSGGERRRCSIGMELLAQPAVCFADEPTSGLDAHTAMTALQILRSLAEQKSCLVCVSIHQPSTPMLQLFSKFLLMAEGQMVFFGTLEDAITFFGEQGFPLPERMNPTDHFMAVLAEGDQEERVQRAKSLASAFKQARGQSAPVTEAGPPLKESPERASFAEAFIVLLTRMWRNTFRNKYILPLRTVNQVVFAIVLGIMYGFQGPNNMDTSQAGIFKRQASIFIAVFIVYITSAVSTAQVFCAEKGSFLREHQSGYYSVPTYFLARTLAELPMALVLPASFASFAWLIVGWSMSLAEIVFSFVMVYNAAQGIGFILAGPANTVEEALNLEPPITLINLMLSGFFVNLATMPAAVQWLQYTTVFRYAMGALLQFEFQGRAFYCTEDEMAALRATAQDPSAVVCPVTDGSEVLRLRELDTISVRTCGAVLIGFMIGFRLLGALAVWTWTYSKRTL